MLPTWTLWFSTYTVSEELRTLKLEVRKAVQLPLGGRAFLILKAALDATEEAGLGVRGRR
jgi:hypothetical protein